MKKEYHVYTMCISPEIAAEIYFTGLSERLTLVNYQYDMTGMMLPEGAAFGSRLEASSSVVPEPGTGLLLVIGGALLAFLRYRRPLHPAA